jgi:hypothetical protein
MVKVDVSLSTSVAEPKMRGAEAGIVSPDLGRDNKAAKDPTTGHCLNLDCRLFLPITLNNFVVPERRIP